MKNKKEVEIYFYNIRSAFPVYHAHERAYLNDLKSCVYDYMEIHNNVTMDQIINEFGSPTEIVCAYLTSVDADYLFHNIKRSHYMKYTAFAVFFLLMVLISYRCYRLEKAIHLAEEQIVTTIEETVEETTETVIDGEIFNE